MCVCSSSCQETIHASGWCQGHALGGVSLPCWKKRKNKPPLHLNTPKPEAGTLPLKTVHPWCHHTPWTQMREGNKEAPNRKNPPFEELLGSGGTYGSKGGHWGHCWVQHWVLLCCCALNYPWWRVWTPPADSWTEEQCPGEKRKKSTVKGTAEHFQQSIFVDSFGLVRWEHWHRSDTLNEHEFSRKNGRSRPGWVGNSRSTKTASNYRT